MLKTIIISTVLMSLATVTSAQSSEIYRYKDEKGKIIYTDKIPANLNVKVETLSKRSGIMKGAKQLSQEEAEQLAQKEEQDKQTTKKNGEQLRKDQSLLNMYSSVKDIEDMKKYELDQIDRAIQNDINVVASLSDRKNQLEKEMQKNPKAKEQFSQEYNRISENLDKTNTNLAKNKEMYSQRESKYNQDKSRFVEILKEMGKPQESKK